jgi:hypothetical protein
MRTLLTRILAWTSSKSQSGNQSVLTCTIRIEPGGEHAVTFNPADFDPDHLVRLIACYLAKVRWLLDSEPRQILEAWRLFVDDALEYWGSHIEEGFLDSLPSASHYRKDPEGQWAVEGGETFTIRLIPARTQGGFYVSNDLPRSGLAVNNAWHTVLLLAESRAKLPETHRKLLSGVLLSLREDFFSESMDPSLQSLRCLTTRANDVMDNAFEGGWGQSPGYIVKSCKKSRKKAGTDST